MLDLSNLKWNNDGKLWYLLDGDNFWDNFRCVATAYLLADSATLNYDFVKCLFVHVHVANLLQYYLHKINYNL